MRQNGERDAESVEKKTMEQWNNEKKVGGKKNAEYVTEKGLRLKSNGKCQF